MIILIFIYSLLFEFYVEHRKLFMESKFVFVCLSMREHVHESGKGRERE